MAKMTPHGPGGAAERPRAVWALSTAVGIVIVGLLLARMGARWYGPASSPVDVGAIQRQAQQLQQAVALLTQAREKLAEGSLREAMTLADQAVAISPQLAEAHFIAGHVALQLREYGRARQEFRTVLERNPDSVEAKISLANVAAAQKDYPQARQLLAEALPEIEQQGAPPAALRMLEAAANLDRPAVAADLLAQALQAPDGPEVALREAKLFGPDLLAPLGEAMNRKAMAANAAQAYAAASEMAPEPAAKARWAARAAELFLAAGDAAAATAHVSLALQADPANPQWIMLQERLKAASATQTAPATHATPDGTLPAFGLPAQ